MTCRQGSRGTISKIIAAELNLELRSSGLRRVIGSDLAGRLHCPGFGRCAVCGGIRLSFRSSLIYSRRPRLMRCTTMPPAMPVVPVSTLPVRRAIWTILADRTLTTATRRRDPGTTASRRVRTIMSETALPAGSWPPRRSSRWPWWWSSGPKSCTRSSSSNRFSPRRFDRICLSLADRRALDRVSLIFPRT
jgi:hypothetical protein